MTNVSLLRWELSAYRKYPRRNKCTWPSTQGFLERKPHSLAISEWLQGFWKPLGAFIWAVAVHRLSWPSLKATPPS